MRRLWISDVHANLPAFEAVLADAGEVDEIVFLGDIVGYGPHPSACVDLLKTLEAKVIRGNHDASTLAIRTRSTPRRTHPVDWDEWTYDHLNDSQLSYLAGLPSELTVNLGGAEAKAIHHPPGAPYLDASMPDELLARHFQTVPSPVVLCGHSHRPLDRTIRGRRYIVIPAVGQPRNRDPRAGYAVECGGHLEFRFVEYDTDGYARDVENVGLAETFCQRWIRFIRTGYDTEWSREYRR